MPAEPTGSVSPVPERGITLALDAPDGDADADAAVTRVYLAAIQHPDPSRSLLVAQGMRSEVVDRSLAVLQDRGLVRLHRGGAVDVVPPDISLPSLALTYERRARETRSAAHELAQVFFQARSASTSPDPGSIRILASLDEVAAVTAEAVAAGTRLVWTFRSPSPRTDAIFASPLHSHEEPTRGTGGQVLEMRSVYDSRILEVPDVLTVLEARERGGERARFTAGVPFSCVIVDDAVAVVDVSAFDTSGSGSALVRSRPMVLALIALAEHLWTLGSPLRRPGSGSVSDQRDQLILSLLAAGAPDATIARQTGVSQRTVERRVRALMDQLGASTRFQAGVQAARHGLL